MERHRHIPDQTYTSLKQNAIRDTYERLSPEERARIDYLIEKIVSTGIKNMGRVAALELVGSVAIRLARPQQSRSRR